MADKQDIAWVDNRRLIDPITTEIWHLVQQATSMEDVRWLVALDECFENREFLYENAGNLRWRLFVLADRGVPVNKLTNLIDKMLPLEVKAKLAKEKMFP